MKEREKQLKQIRNVLKLRQQLKQYLQNKDFMDKSLFEESAKVQAPTTQAITESKEETKKALNVINKTIYDKGIASNQEKDNITSKQVIGIEPPGKLKPLDKTEGSFYGLIKTSSTIHSPVFDETFFEWKVNSASQSNVGRMILFEKNGNDNVWDLL